MFVVFKRHAYLLNRNLLIVSLVLTVNTLGYGIILPLIFSYSQKFGLSIFENGLLFSLFSICQFISTPIIGRASDKYGRRPLLIISLAGTALSFFIMAFAPNAFFLYLARILDGITAGNIPVASAVISDTAKPEERARSFGIISGAFNFGFIFGPLISALTVGISPSLPFIIAGIIASISVVLTILLLPETNKYLGQVKKEKLFDFVKLAKELLNEKIGRVLLNTLIYSTAFGMFIYAFQPFSLDVLRLSTSEISAIFVVFGIVGLLMQFFGVSFVIQKFGVKKTYVNAFFFLALTFIALFFVKSLLAFVIVSVLLSMANSLTFPLTQTLLSESADHTEQGAVQGVNSSYMSVGQILGPIIAGLFASITIQLPFLIGGLIMMVCFMISRKAVSFA